MSASLLFILFGTKLKQVYNFFLQYKFCKIHLSILLKQYLYFG